MIKRIIKELLYYTITLVVLALFQHQDLLTAPAKKFHAMEISSNYLHPFIWALAIYLFIASFRWLFGIVMRLKK
jgi:hypothetical protein